MAPVKPKAGGKPSSKGSRSTSGPSKPTFSKKPSKANLAKRPPPKEQKSKPRTAQEKLKKRKDKVYSDKELGLPTLNMITPVGVQKPKGKKKGKIFVDDQESMMTILAMVNAEKEGQIESKMMKARQMEEIREARKAEMEARQDFKKKKLEDVKDSLRKKKSKKSAADEAPAADSKPSKKKRVAFV